MAVRNWESVGPQLATHPRPIMSSSIIELRATERLPAFYGMAVSDSVGKWSPPVALSSVTCGTLSRA
jgi:hypothetical protein